MTEPTDATTDTGADPNLAGADGPVAGGDAAGHQTAPVDDANSQSTEASGPDLSFLDEGVRSKLADHLDPDTAEELRKGYLRLDYMTKARQKDSALRKAAEEQAAQLREAAEKWQSLESDDGLRQTILDYWNGKTTQPTEPDVPDDLWARDPKEAARVLADYVAAKITPQQSQALDPQKIKEEIIREQQAPLLHAQELWNAAEEHGTGLGYQPDQIEAACKAMTEDHGGAANLTPEMVTRLLPRYAGFIEIQSKREAAAREAQSTQRTNEQARAASPRGGEGVSTGGTGVDLNAIVARLREEKGRDPDISEIAPLAYKAMMDQASAKTGKPRSELEEELSRDPWAFRPVE